MKKISLIIFSLVISSCSLIPDKDFGDQSQRLDKLSVENRVIAEDLIQFIKDSDEKYFKWSGCINNDDNASLNSDCPDSNGNTSDETFISDTKYSDFDVRVARDLQLKKLVE